ncbi:hypothetical protein BGW39_003766 [Mortierella sp. 14UC]|nr:hypothetical protein BGW39_003766 [Mortierella sp. 14UC]
MIYNVEFKFTGAMKCKLLFCTDFDLQCGCITCKTFNICSHHAMHMNLVSFDDTARRNFKDLDIMVFGSDLGGI